MNHKLVGVVTRLRGRAVLAVSASIAVIGRRPRDNDRHRTLVRRADGVSPGRRARLHHSAVKVDNVRRLGDVDLKFGRRNCFGTADCHCDVEPLVWKKPACWQVHDEVILERGLAAGGQPIRVFDRHRIRVSCHLAERREACDGVESIHDGYWTSSQPSGFVEPERDHANARLAVGLAVGRCRQPPRVGSLHTAPGLARDPGVE